MLAARVPHPREVVRASLERLLARGWLLAAGSAAAAAALGGRLASRLEQELGAVAADPVVQSLGAAGLEADRKLSPLKVHRRRSGRWRKFL